jgi:hypothetical protein
MLALGASIHDFARLQAKGDGDNEEGVDPRAKREDDDRE